MQRLFLFFLFYFTPILSVHSSLTITFKKEVLDQLDAIHGLIILRYKIPTSPKSKYVQQPKKYHCENCSYLTYCKRNLTRHKIVHVYKEKFFSCTICDGKFISPISLGIHQKSCKRYISEKKKFLAVSIKTSRTDSF